MRRTLAEEQTELRRALLELRATVLAVLTAPRALISLAVIGAVLACAVYLVYSIVDTWAT